MKSETAFQKGVVKTRSGGWRLGACMYDRGPCVVCGDDCFVTRYSRKKSGVFICTVECRHKYSASKFYGGRTINSNGYIEIQLPDHPMSKKDGAVMEHRLVMAQHIGRMLEPHEVVHHKDHNRQNNAIENLELAGSNREHLLLHGQDSELRKLKQEGMLRCSACREIKPLEAFALSKSNRHGYDNKCRACNAAYYKKTHPDNKPLGVKLGEWHRKQWEASENYGLFLEGKKQCRLCKEVKPLDAFSPNADLQDGKMSYCKQCRRERYGGKK